jgi:malate dehydrogenase (oxaloacetate-decarboxylating)(NADP+)
MIGMSKPIHVLVPSVTARGIVNLSALAVLQAQSLPAAGAPAQGRLAAD